MRALRRPHDSRCPAWDLQRLGAAVAPAWPASPGPGLPAPAAPSAPPLSRAAGAILRAAARAGAGPKWRRRRASLGAEGSGAGGGPKAGRAAPLAPSRCLGASGPPSGPCPSQRCDTGLGSSPRCGVCPRPGGSLTGKAAAKLQPKPGGGGVCSRRELGAADASGGDELGILKALNITDSHA